MRFLRNLIVLAVVGGMAYGYLKSHPESRAASWGRNLIREFLGDGAGEGYSEGPLVDHPAELFDFSITPDWVEQQWTEVSTGLSDPRFSGYRVALVTGGEARDLAGALTYYFDRRDRLRRVAFVGKTGDARFLVGWVKDRFGFRWQDQNGTEATYGARRGGYRGSLKIAPRHHLGSGDPEEFDVELVVVR